MPSIRLFLLPLAVGLLATPSALAEETPYKSHEFRTVLKGVQHALWGTASNRKKVRASWDRKSYLQRAMSKSQAKSLAKLLANGNPFLTAKSGGRIVMPIDTIDPKTKSKVLFKMAPGYRPGRGTAGLVICVHGGPQSVMAKADREASNEYNYFSRAATQYKLAIASPPILAWRADPAGAKVILGIIEEASKRWNIDRNRVWLVGHSAGGVTSFMVGCPNADRLAGIAPFVCGIHHGKRLDNAYNLPVYHVLGKRDNSFFLSTGRQNSAYLKKLGGPLMVVEKDGGHDVYPGECVKSLGWLTKRPRKFWTKDVRWSPDQYRKASGFYWVEASNSSPWSVKVDGQKITITGTGPTALLLSDELLNLDKEVEVVRGGRSLFKGKVARSLQVALDWVTKTGDFSAVPVARVVVN